MKYLIFLLALCGCTATTRARYAAFGSQAHVQCYSGDMITYSGMSTGVIHTVEGSDGWEFMDDSTKRLVRVSGACVIRY